jgi:hypothetical protein
VVVKKTLWRHSASICGVGQVERPGYEHGVAAGRGHPASGLWKEDWDGDMTGNDDRRR